MRVYFVVVVVVVVASKLPAHIPDKCGMKSIKH